MICDVMPEFSILLSAAEAQQGGVVGLGGGLRVLVE